jgi:hypothetical protein
VLINYAKVILVLRWSSLHASICYPTYGQYELQIRQQASCKCVSLH